ncbi:hypothetical protein [Aestuariivivens insulae]|uniref:hypothetical protein n=1 Tax=Aestuariivivens insulae TaxID=1621988 RepID=UPI001F58FC52|nr:hypothetical protein [Aestuariivivens insulae]
MNIYIIFGILALIGIVAFSSWNSKRNLKTNKIVRNQIENLITEKQETIRTLTLVVAYDFGQNLETITEKATPEIIKSTMDSINWNEFHMVQLEDESDNGFKGLHVSGSLVEDGLASGFVTDDDHILMVKPIKTVKQMTEILLDFLEGEEYWRSKYEYK